MHLGTEGFVDHAKQALEDAPLQEALHLLTTNFAPRRVAAMAALGNAEELRTRTRAIKEHTIAHLDHYLEQFAAQLTELGVQVHWADDAAEARAIIVSIAEGVDAKVVVKGKSMATEEIQLNDHLEAEGYEVVETDLGEYIIQLAGEAPSHIIAPAIHKTRKQIAELLHDKLQTPYTEVIPEMTQIARHSLRQKFFQADVGITSVNFAIAETGSVVIVTNEGNGRLSSTMPKVHVAVMGMEKVIPRLADLSVMLKVLTNSATGQKISSYVTMMTGPRRGHDLDGPQAQHVVILDNGRTSILRSANREALYCLRCGACLNVCPIYQNIGGHAYGWVYPGPIGAVLTPLFVGLESASDLPRASTLCGACRDACPVKINIPHMLLQLRQELAETQHKAHWSEKTLFALWARMMQRPRWYGWATKLAALAHAPLAREGWVGKLPPPFHGWTQSRDFKAPAAVSFRQRWQQTLQHEGQEGAGEPHS
ncbi:MAG: (Fe-S)-binding protein [Candidatus Entotheonella factor]|uniref:(Fe-S)-binding protein n=1 Tax=Entotheonella factor TaxID=1429438 RepID=W4LQP4_ENTF1|nr:MAG: (Fe-S)-binding protein [Candidatus Entotheonella factor]